MANRWSAELPWRRVVGELAIIIAGVLIALWIEEWRQARIDRHSETEYIARLRVDVEADIQRIDGLIEHTRERERDAMVVLAFLNSDRESGDRDLIRAMSEAGYLAFFQYQRSTMDELLSTGGLALLKDKDLVREINSYYRGADFLLQFDNQKREWIWMRFRDLISDHVPSLVVANVESGEPDGDYAVDWARLRNDPAFREGLGSVISLARVERGFLNRLRQRAVDLTRSLNAAGAQP